MENTRLQGLLLFCLFVLATPSFGKDAYGPGYQPFVSGNTILVCNHPADARITQENFDKMFPSLSVYVHQQWESGIVSSAYLLSTIDQGIMLIVKDGGGKSSRQNAESILNEIVGLFAKNDVPLKASCVLHDVGPVWLDESARDKKTQ